MLVTTGQFVKRNGRRRRAIGRQIALKRSKLPGGRGIHPLFQQPCRWQVKSINNLATNRIHQTTSTFPSKFNFGLTLVVAAAGGADGTKLVESRSRSAATKVRRKLSLLAMDMRMPARDDRAVCEAERASVLGQYGDG